MAIQTVNTYAFNVKRLSLMMKAGQNVNANTDAGVAASVGLAAYQGEQVYVSALDRAGAQAVLVAQYSTDLGPVSGGAIKTPGVLTTMTGT
jgi:hypothetical protein